MVVIDWEGLLKYIRQNGIQRARLERMFTGENSSLLRALIKNNIRTVADLLALTRQDMLMKVGFSLRRTNRLEEIKGQLRHHLVRAKLR